MHNQTAGSRTIWVLAFLTLPLWMLSFPETTVSHNLKPFFVYGSQAVSLVGFSLFALSFVLATRFSWLEDYFGGLDRVYHFHHNIARISLILLVIHPLLLVFRWIPEDTGRIFWYLFPVHRRFDINLGSWSLLGLILLMIMTLTIRLPYDKWKITHKFMGVFFILGVGHIFFLDLSFSENLPLTIYLSLLSLAGIAAWIYKTFLFDLLKHKLHYHVKKVDRLNEKVMEIELSPVNGKAEYTPGQFYFFSFCDKNISRESHPYTICERTSKGTIRIMVKSLGDYTGKLYQVLKPGTESLLEGPYGRFNFRTGRTDQVWIAGGVGIAPFISWANDLISDPRNDLHADLYYCVNTRREATHLDVFDQLKENLPGFNLHLICSDEEGFLQPGKIPDLKERDIYICGPRPMRKILLFSMRELKVPPENILYEDFDFS
ncbi:MAG: ferric reductase-like transmembrane domain-containing protein [Balneolaceae bacterium]